jgi:hypothetical protein
MSTRRRRCARSTGVSLEIAVLEYLRELADRSERDRSFCINQIVREHAERHGHPLTPPPLPPEVPTSRPVEES